MIRIAKSNRFHTVSTSGFPHSGRPLDLEKKEEEKKKEKAGKNGRVLGWLVIAMASGCSGSLPTRLSYVCSFF
jgi:hypothetical protein